MEEEYGLFNSPSIIRDFAVSSDEESYDLYKDMQQIPNVPMPSSLPKRRKLFRRDSSNNFRQDFHNFLLKLKHPLEVNVPNNNVDNSDMAFPVSPVVMRRNSILSSNLKKNINNRDSKHQRSVCNNSVKVTLKHLKAIRQLPYKRKKRHKYKIKKKPIVNRNINTTVDFALQDNQITKSGHESGLDRVNSCAQTENKSPNITVDPVFLVPSEKETQTTDSLRRKSEKIYEIKNNQEKSLIDKQNVSNLQPTELGEKQPKYDNFILNILEKVDSVIHSPGSVISLSSTVNTIDEAGPQSINNDSLKKDSLSQSHTHNILPVSDRTLRSKTRTLNSILETPNTISQQNVGELPNNIAYDNQHNDVEKSKGDVTVSTSEIRKNNPTKSKLLDNSTQKNLANVNCTNRRQTRQTSRLLNSLMSGTNNNLDDQSINKLTKTDNNIGNEKSIAINNSDKIEGIKEDTVINARSISRIDESVEVNMENVNKKLSIIPEKPNTRTRLRKRAGQEVEPNIKKSRSRKTKNIENIESILSQCLTHNKLDPAEVQKDQTNTNENSTRGNGRPKRSTKPPKTFIQAVIIGKNDLESMMKNQSTNKGNRKSVMKKPVNNKNNKDAKVSVNNNRRISKNEKNAQNKKDSDTGSPGDPFKKPQGRAKRTTKKKTTQSITTSTPNNNNLTSSTSYIEINGNYKKDEVYNSAQVSYDFIPLASNASECKSLDNEHATKPVIIHHHAIISPNECDKNVKKQNVQMCDFNNSDTNEHPSKSQKIHTIVDNQVTSFDWFGEVPKLDETKTFSASYVLTNMKSHCCVASCGYLMFGPGQHKVLLPRKHSIVYKVEQGRALVSQQLATQVMNNHHMFYIPLGSRYKIKNLSDTESLVLYFHKISQRH